MLNEGHNGVYRVAYTKSLMTQRHKSNEEKETLTLIDECLKSIYSQTRGRRHRVGGLKDKRVEAAPGNCGDNEFARATTIDMLHKLTVGDPRFNVSRISRKRSQSTVAQRDGAAKAQSLAEENALAIEEAFDHEVANWEVGHRKATEKEREHFADHLTERFLCRQLDPLPSTALVSATRRRVAAAIESVISTASSREKLKEEHLPWSCPICGKTNVLPSRSCILCKRELEPSKLKQGSSRMSIQQHNNTK